MIEVLVAAMVISLLLQSAIRSHERLYASSIFVGISVLHLFLAEVFSALGGLWPYLIAASFDVIIMTAMARVKIVVATTIYLHRICGAEIVLNIAGWLMWEMELQYYDRIYLVAFSILSAYTIYILLRKDGVNDKHGFKVDSWTDLIRMVAYPRDSITQRGGK